MAMAEKRLHYTANYEHSVLVIVIVLLISMYALL